MGLVVADVTAEDGINVVWMDVLDVASEMGKRLTIMEISDRVVTAIVDVIDEHGATSVVVEKQVPMHTKAFAAMLQLVGYCNGRKIPITVMAAVDKFKRLPQLRERYLSLGSGRSKDHKRLSERVVDEWRTMPNPPIQASPEVWQCCDSIVKKDDYSDALVQLVAAVRGA